MQFKLVVSDPKAGIAMRTLGRERHDLFSV
jgi:hypothetical protein